MALVRITDHCYVESTDISCVVKSHDKYIIKVCYISGKYSEISPSSVCDDKDMKIGDIIRMIIEVINNANKPVVNIPPVIEEVKQEPTQAQQMLSMSQRRADTNTDLQCIIANIKHQMMTTAASGGYVLYLDIPEVYKSVIGRPLEIDNKATICNGVIIYLLENGYVVTTTKQLDRYVLNKQNILLNDGIIHQVNVSWIGVSK